jgi:hypothetical protein
MVKKESLKKNLYDTKSPKKKQYYLNITAKTRGRKSKKGFQK